MGGRRSGNTPRYLNLNPPLPTHSHTLTHTQAVSFSFHQTLHSLLVVTMCDRLQGEIKAAKNDLERLVNTRKHAEADLHESEQLVCLCV